MPLLRGWLSTPEVARWWGDPSEQAAMLEEDLSEPGMEMRIVSLDAKPFAYAQDYAVDRWPQPHFAGLPPGSRAIDSFSSRSIPPQTTSAPVARTKRPDLWETE